MSALFAPVIRKSQLQAMGVAAREVFAERLARHVATVFSTHASYVRRPAGLRFINRCIDAALRHHLKDQHSIALYTDLVVALGTGFESKPRHQWLLAILNDRGLSAPARMYLIYDQLPERCPEPPLPPPDDDDGAPAAAPAVAVPLWPPGSWG